MIAQFLVVAVLPLLLAVAAAWDLASFTIPNLLQGLLLAAFLAFAMAAGLTPAMLGAHALAGLIGLAAGFALFARGLIGGGDAKLFAMVALWLGFHDLLPYALLASLCGGGLTLSLLAMRRWPLPATLARQDWILRLHDEKSGIPYGVALAAGAFLILPYTDIFRQAAAA
jgi:prepilin peptidase CpaA